MREEFVILVSLFIGIGGFAITPDIIVKKKDELSTVEKSVKDNNLEVKNLNETELYHEGIGENINVSQRASVYINQKFRKQFRNHMYKVLVPRVEYIQDFITNTVPYINALKVVMTTQTPKNKLFVPNIPNVAHQKYPHRQYNYQNEPMYNPPPPPPQQLSNHQHNQRRYQQNQQQSQRQNQQLYQHQNQPKHVKIYNDHNDLPLVTREPTRTELKLANLQKEEQERIFNTKPLQEHQEMVRPYITKPSIKSIPDSKAIGKNKGRITSLTNRKTDNIKCGFPDPHLLHRSSFHNRPSAVMKMVMNKNMNQKSYMRDNYENLINKDWQKTYSDINLENLSGLSEEDDKIDKYIKDALEDKEKIDDINAYIKMMKNSKYNNLRNNMKGQMIIDNNI